jgi:hypothetical protein
VCKENDQDSPETMDRILVVVHIINNFKPIDLVYKNPILVKKRLRRILCQFMNTNARHVAIALRRSFFQDHT